jgi:hypothetical protein
MKLEQDMQETILMGCHVLLLQMEVNNQKD